MKSYSQHVSTKETPQVEPIPGKPMVPNSAGGFSFQVSDWQRLDRFLVLGCEAGSYYATEKKLTIENAECVRRCVEADAERTVNRIVEISDAGRAPKNDPAIFALAICASKADEKSRKLALAALPKVCRIGTHLFHFAAACNDLRGWGRSLRNAMANWYTAKTPAELAYGVIKYQSRDGWSHRDVMRLAHVKTSDPAMQAVIRWAVRGAEGMGEVTFARKVKGGDKPATYPAVAGLPEVIAAFESIKNSTDAKAVAEAVRKFNLPRECVPTAMLNELSVWEALLEKMPMTAMIRNLGNMSKVGLLKPMSAASKIVCDALGNVESLKKSRVHPLSILIAMKTYAQGKGMKGSGEWSPVQDVVDALDGAFYSAFDFVEPTNKRWFFGIDVSGSMGAQCAGSPVTCCEAATALALVTNRVEKQTFVGRFNTGMEPVPFGRTTRMNDALTYTRSINGGGTDCALPMLYAAEKGIETDAFVVLTDNETYAGKIHPVQALKKYRDKTGIAAKLIVVGMVANEFTIADPSDPGMLDVVGFSTDVPAVMAEFVR